MKSEKNKLSVSVEGEAVKELYRLLNDNSAELSDELENLYYNIQNILYSQLTVAEFEEIISK